MPVSRNISTLQQGVCTSATRPSNPFNGQMIYETDTSRIYMYQTSYGNWLIQNEPWQSYTPTLAQGATTDIAKTVNYSEYTRMGRTVHYQFRISITGTGTAGSALSLSLPFQNTITSAAPIIGDGFVYDSSAGTVITGNINATFTGFCQLVTSAGAGQSWGANPNIAIANGDIYSGAVTYRWA